MMTTRISAPEVDATLDVIGDWFRKGTTLVVDYEFGSRGDAAAFKMAVVDVSDDTEHRLEWSDNANRLGITLTSRRAGGVTDADLEFARRIVILAAARGGRAV